MKLHLGCGERYMEGYVNIDFPPEKHSVQKDSVADLNADLLTLRYPAESIDEVRLHHVFEHFPRPIACALLSVWHTWLRPGGILHLEVPDFSRNAAILLNPLSSLKSKAVAERHLYGSHEATWATHCEGYTPAMLKAFLTAFGFESLSVRKNCWRGTHNIVFTAYRGNEQYQLSEFLNRARKFLLLFLLDDSPGEQVLLDVWLETFSLTVVRMGLCDG
jgi:hypothetical protein